MARITIDKFGGVLPSREVRALPPGNGQKAENLDLRYGDFRPIKGTGASVATVGSGTVSIHLAPSGTVLESTTDANFVNSQVNDPTVDRVYVTGKAAFPQVWSGGTYYRLGVRAPTTAPTLTHNVVDEFTREEWGQSVRNLIESVNAAVIANITTTMLGNPKPSNPGSGRIFLAHGENVDLPTSLDTQICYLSATTAGAINLASDSYLLQPILNGKLVTHSAQQYIAVPALWRAVGYTINEAGLSTAIKALLKPPENTVQLVPDDVADQIASRIVDIADATADPLAILVDRINAAQAGVLNFQSRDLSDIGRAYALQAALDKLEVAIRDVDRYFVTWKDRVEQVLADYRHLLPDYVTREVETRYYVYTYVNAWNEESAPSPVSDVVEIDQNDTVTVTIASPPATGDYVAFSSWRLYRSSTTNDGAEYQLVAETAIGTLTYTDSKLQEELEDSLPLTIQNEPRSDMVNLCGGANGIMLGSAGKVLCPCEPFLPFAFPRAYELTVGYEVVAIASIGSSWIVLTKGDTYLVTGSDSASLSAQKLPRSQACVSKRSVAAVEGGALFASPDGICMVDTSGVTLLTEGAYTREDWQALTPASSLGVFHDGVYHLWLSTAGIRLSLSMGNGEMSRTTVAAPSAAHSLMLTDTLYTVSGTSVLPNFAGSAQTGVYRTGIIQTNSHPSFAYLQVQGEHTSVTVKTYADGALVHTATVTNNVPQRHPAVRGRYWEIELQSTSRFSRFILASSAEELRE